MSDAPEELLSSSTPSASPSGSVPELPELLSCPSSASSPSSELSLSLEEFPCPSPLSASELEPSPSDEVEESFPSPSPSSSSSDSVSRGGVGCGGFFLRSIRMSGSLPSSPSCPSDSSSVSIPMIGPSSSTSSVSEFEKFLSDSNIALSISSSSGGSLIICGPSPPFEGGSFAIASRISSLILSAIANA